MDWGVDWVARRTGSGRDLIRWDVFRELDALVAFRRVRRVGLLRRAAAILRPAPWCETRRAAPGSGSGDGLPRTPGEHRIPIRAIVGMVEDTGEPVPLPVPGRGLRKSFLRAFLARDERQPTLRVQTAATGYLLLGGMAAFVALEVLRARGVRFARVTVVCPQVGGARVLNMESPATHGDAVETCADNACTCAQGRTGAA